MTRTATAKQLTYIHQLLAERQHTDNGRTITVGETRFRTTADHLDTISSAVASRLITALKNAPLTGTARRDAKRRAPHFIRDREHGGWVVAGLDHLAAFGDIITVTRRDGTRETVQIDEVREVLDPASGMHIRVADFTPVRPGTPSERDAFQRDAERLDHEFAERVDASPATSAQVSYIMDLLHQGAADEGGFFRGPRTLEGVRALSRRDASQYIDSLTGEY
ncbi:hypothetical protein [Corynebacterium sp.]|uniref:hypothetical protein n=1 Tax=Corynebacterium sp. TaxID=1720 RepID=UPI0026DB746F|nr:hypothetical protein [Corynebacterium sp.]MDO4610942.1 hypothetical protein [Corynebacterium sp.]